MSKIRVRLLVVLMFLLGFVTTPTLDTQAEGKTMEAIGTSISLTPTSKILQISSNSIYDDSFTVSNDGDTAIRVEVYAAPYSYVYSSEEGSYRLGYNNENNFTQLTRWITFKDASGNYVEKPVFLIDPHASLKISFRITTPGNIPGGGQYAVIFAHTLSEAIPGSGIRTEASPGIVVYGRSSEGEAVVEADISNLNIVEEDESVVATAKVRNSGNIDFTASGVLKIEPILGSVADDSQVRYLSVIPDAELILSNSQENVPWLGIYKAVWEVSAGEKNEKIEKIIVRVPLFIVIIVIFLLTFLIVGIIIMVRRRKERRSRFSA